jgi:protein-disulfide isomerase
MSRDLTTKHLMSVFIPAIALGVLILAITIKQYQPLYPSTPAAAPQSPTTLQTIPLLPDDPILGNKKAGHTIIIFGDFGCESCHTQMALLEELLQTSGQKMKIVWKGLPATRIPYPSDTAHLYAYCVNKHNKFLPFADSVFSSIDNLLPTNLDALVTAQGLSDSEIKSCSSGSEAKQYMTDTQSIAQNLNIQAVPTIFLDNIQIQPPTTIEGWQALVS